MAKVAHYIDQWLALSQGFVYGLASRSRHSSVVITRERQIHAGAFPMSKVVSLHRVVGLMERPPARRLKLAAAAVVLDRRLRPDIVHVHFGYYAREGVAIARRRHPVVVSLHGHDITALTTEHPDYYAGVWDNVDAVVVPSQFLAKSGRSHGVPAEILRVIPSGFDSCRFAPSTLPEGPPTVLFVGRLVEKKGLRVLLDAWDVVSRAHPEAQLEVIGDGPLRSLLDSRGLRVLHRQPDVADPTGQVSDAMSRCYVVVSPSHVGEAGDSESLLIVNLEAQASGRPVVTTRHGGIPEFVSEGRTAIVVPESSPRALADALVHVLDDRSLANAMGQAGPKWAQQFDIARGAARIDDLYDELLASGGISR